MGLFGKKSFDKLDKKNLIQVKGIKDIRKSLKQLGETEKSSRSSNKQSTKTCCTESSKGS